MSSEVTYVLLLSAAFLVLFGTAEILYLRFGVKAENTRKYVHIGTGFLTLLFPLLLRNHWSVLCLCGSFAVLLWLSMRYHFLRSINAVERDTLGSLAYPAAVYGCYLAFQFRHNQLVFFYLPVLILALCDPIAALAGKKWPVGKYRIGKDTKTLMGSGMFFFSALLLCFLLSLICDTGTWHLKLAHMVAIAAFSAIAEGVTGKGLDNIAIPLSVLIILFAVHP